VSVCGIWRTPLHLPLLLCSYVQSWQVNLVIHHMVQSLTQLKH
jgi:hypothetical protein